jgi:glc operon protein GlcG
MANALNYAAAQAALGAAIEKAREMNIAVAVAVVDDKGAPVALGRMDGARYFTSEVAMGKAKASAMFGRPSGRLAENVPDPIKAGAANATGGHPIFWQGAVPIMVDGSVAGAIGASGSSSENDEVVSQAGVDAALASAVS